MKRRVMNGKKPIIASDKSILFLVLILLLGACTATPTPTPTATQTLIPTLTGTIKPSATAVPSVTATIQPTLTATKTSTITSTPICLQLLTPVDGIELANTGKMVFTWKSLVNAATYKIELIPPNGKEISFISKGTQYSRYAESIPMGGEFTWQVIALDENGKELCSSVASSFEKPELPPTGIPGSQNSSEGSIGGESVPPPPPSPWDD
jgi:hypothetical protein